MIEVVSNNVEDVIARIQKNNFLEKSALFIWGVLIYALSFSVFFSIRDIVTGGSAGLSLIVNNLCGMDMSIFVFIFSIITLVLGYLFLGKRYAIKCLFGVILLPVFMKFTEIFNMFVHLDKTSLFLIVFFGGFFMGLGNGIIIRSGFSVGGVQTLAQIMYKKFGLSIGKASMLVNGIIVLLGGMLFGISNVLYAIVALYISSAVTDRVILETSTSKTFFIVTKKYEEISEYITYALGHGVTVINARGGYRDDKKKVLMCNIPTRKYYEAKESIQTIDDGAFFLITDTYEIYGGM